MEYFLSSHSSIERLSSTAKTIIKVLLNCGFKFVAIQRQIIFRHFTILRNILKDFRKSSTNRRGNRYFMELRNRPAINQTYR